ncbi:uncharacterized protein LOC131846206 [Achroia grisella]|uniref:uncharacterized protein LOC131846206 n=1 Tax=Achroia grisella TaxID=688607 RepID=UPI0027D26915|nr:uncharacterized protein LOC131846206 [Achroia grisella]
MILSISFRLRYNCKLAFITKYSHFTMNSSNEDVTWRGAPISEIIGSQSPWGAPEFPLVTPAYNHAVLYHIPSSGSIPTDVAPKPQVGQDKWDQDHVRMPCSPHSLYPVEGKNGKPRLKKRWELIQHALWKPIRNSEELANAILSYNTKFKSIWKFQALHMLFNDYLEEEETQYFFDVTLPEIAKLTLALPKLVQAPIPLLKQNKNHSVSLSQQQIASLLANAFFCTFPRRNSNKRSSEYASYPNINFSALYECNSVPVLEKLKCICHYFKRVTEKVPVGVMTFSRRAVPRDQLPDWAASTRTLAVPLHIDSATTIEDSHGLIQLDFANKYLGGGVLGHGCVQEEIRFVICPELIISMLFTEMLLSNEAVMMIGCERFSTYEGYGSTFRWAGSFPDNTPPDGSGRRRTAVLAIDALPHHSTASELTPAAVLRDLNKAWVGLSWWGSGPGAQLPGAATGNFTVGELRPARPPPRPPPPAPARLPHLRGPAPAGQPAPAASAAAPSPSVSTTPPAPRPPPPAPRSTSAPSWTGACWTSCTSRSAPPAPSPLHLAVSAARTLTVGEYHAAPRPPPPAPRPPLAYRTFGDRRLRDSLHLAVSAARTLTVACTSRSAPPAPSPSVSTTPPAPRPPPPARARGPALAYRTSPSGTGAYRGDRRLRDSLHLAASAARTLTVGEYHAARPPPPAPRPPLAYRTFGDRRLRDSLHLAVSAARTLTVGEYHAARPPPPAPRPPLAYRTFGDRRLRDSLHLAVSAARTLTVGDLHLAASAARTLTVGEYHAARPPPPAPRPPLAYRTFGDRRLRDSLHLAASAARTLRAVAPAPRPPLAYRPRGPVRDSLHLAASAARTLPVACTARSAPPAPSPSVSTTPPAPPPPPPAPRPPLAYRTFGDRRLRDSLHLAVTAARTLTVGELYKYIIQFSRTPNADPENLYDYIEQMITEKHGASMTKSVESVSDESEKPVLLELSSSLEKEFLNDSPDLFSQDESDQPKEESKPDTRSTKDTEPRSSDYKMALSDNKMAASERNAASTSSTSRLFNEMEKFDETNGKLNLTDSNRTQFKQTTKGMSKNMDTSMDCDEKIPMDISVESKKKISKKITDYFSKKSI